MENVLLTFTGFQDPYALGLIGEEEQPGPILSLLATKSFDRVVLFSTPRTEKNTSATLRSLRKLFPQLLVDVVNFPLEDPTDYLAILRGLRKQTQEITYADPLAALPEPSEGFSLEEFVASARKQLILRAMELARGNQSEAARLLGISPQAVHKFLRKSTTDFNQS